jgi:MFS family permease
MHRRTRAQVFAPFGLVRYWVQIGHMWICAFPQTRPLCGAKLLPSYLIVALTVACALFMENLDSTVISTSLPAIAEDLHEHPISLKLALTSYLISLAIFIPASGWAADRFGARTIFRVAILIFILGSILCGISTSLPGLVGARVIQGLGGAMMVPVGRLLLLRSVERSELVNALSYLTVPALLGPMTGPLLGGFITTYFHWRWIFWINVPIGAIGIILATVFVEDVREEVAWPLDVTGFLLCGLGLASLLFGLGGIGRGLMSWQAAVNLAGFGIFALVAFGLHARGAVFPLLDLKLLSISTFRASVAGGSLFRIGIGSIPFLLPLMLQTGFGLTAFHSGSITFIASVGAMAMKATAPRILRLFGFLQCHTERRFPRLLWLLYPLDAGCGHHEFAARRRLRAVARIHQPQRYCLCRNRFRQNERGRQFCFGGAAIVLEPWRRGRSRGAARVRSVQPRHGCSRPWKFQMGVHRDGGGVVERRHRVLATVRGCRV